MISSREVLHRLLIYINILTLSAFVGFSSVQADSNNVNPDAITSEEGTISSGDGSDSLVLAHEGEQNANRVFAAYRVPSSVNAAITNVDCNTITDVSQAECEVLVDLYNSTDGDNWSNNTGWNDDNQLCDASGLACGTGNVTSITLVFRGLNGSINLDFSSFPALGSLALNNNANLAGSITGLPTSLTSFSVRDSNLSSIPTDLSGLTNLTGFDAANNSLSAAFTGMPPNVTNFDISGNSVPGLPADLSSMVGANLRITANNNLITTSFAALPPNIDTFEIRGPFSGAGNAVSGIPADLSGLTSLTQLYLENNDITTSITGLPTSLIQVSLNDNQIAGIPADLSSLTNLTFFRVDNNLITTALTGMPPNVTNFQIDNNQIPGIPADLSSMGGVDLGFTAGGNDITTAITAFPPNARTIAMNDNDIPSIPADLSGLTSLQSINMSTNLITTGITAFPSSIQSIVMTSNQIPSIPADLSALTSLSSLNMTSNEITTGITAFPPNVGFINMGNNDIPSIPSDLSGLTSVSTLSLNNNLITTNITAFPNSATFVNLSNNQLAGIPSDISGLTSLSSFNISNNDLDTVLPVVPNVNSGFWTLCPNTIAPSGDANNDAIAEARDFTWTAQFGCGNSGTPTITLNTSTINLNEGSSDSLIINKNGGPTVTVEFTVTGTREIGDFTAFTGTPGDFSTGTFSVDSQFVQTFVTILANQEADSDDETLILTLVDGATYDIAAPTSVTINVTDDDPPPMVCLDATVTNQTELEAAIVDYNTNCGNGDTLTVTVDGTITLASPLSQVDNATTAQLIIQGDGDDVLDGGDTVRILSIRDGDVAVDTLTLQNGSASGSGAAIQNGSVTNIASTLTVSNSTFTDNAADFAGALGNEQSSTLTVTNSAFTGNSAVNDGGAIYSDGTLVVTNATISGNTAGNVGGAVINNGTGTLINLTVSGNTADSTAILNTDALTLTNVTVANNNNLVNTSSAGIVNAGTLSLNNSILANNTGGTEGDCFSTSTVNFSAGTSNLIETDSGTLPCGTAGVNYINADPLLDTLADNGGDVQTSALLMGSPAINAGDNASAVDADSNPLTTDARGTGFNRILDTTVDIGAFEYMPPPPCQSVTVSTQSELEAAIVDYNTNCGNGDTLTVTVDGTITLASPLSQVGNSTTAQLVIQGDGDDALDGAESVQILSISDGDVTIDTLTVQNGSADFAGAIRNLQAATLTVSNSTFTGNSAVNDGGAIYSDGTLVMTNSTLSGNTAGNVGGAVINNGTGTLINLTATGNTADSTAILSTDALTLTNVTVANNNNLVNTSSAGIVNAGTLSLNNSILANNTGGTEGDCFSIFPVNFSSGISNLIEVDSTSQPCGTPGVNFISADPLLDTLADNGGAVQTLALLTGSPAINAGNNASAVDASSNPLTTDARGTGFERVLGGIVDLGAFEYPSVDVDNDGFVTPADAIYVVNRIGQPKDSSNATADVNNDGVIDQADADLVISEIGTQNP